MIKNNLKFFREFQGISQAELAKKVGISRNSVSSIECGEFIPKLDTAFKLCKVLDVSIYSLFVFIQERKEGLK